MGGLPGPLSPPRAPAAALRDLPAGPVSGRQQLPEEPGEFVELPWLSRD